MRFCRQNAKNVVIGYNSANPDEKIAGPSESSKSLVYKF